MGSDIERFLKEDRPNRQRETLDRAMLTLRRQFTEPVPHRGCTPDVCVEESLRSPVDDSIVEPRPCPVLTPPAFLWFAVAGPFPCRGCGELLRLVRTSYGPAMFDASEPVQHLCPVGHDSRGCLTCGRRQRAIGIGGARSWFPPVPHAYEPGDL